MAGAVAVQRGMDERNAATPEEQRIVFRVGLNLGERSKIHLLVQVLDLVLRVARPCICRQPSGHWTDFPAGGVGHRIQATFCPRLRSGTAVVVLSVCAGAGLVAPQNRAHASDSNRRFSKPSPRR